MAPSLRDRFHVSLGQMGMLISASLAGSVVSLIPWGLAADRVGERWVLLAGVGGAGLALIAASQAGSFETLLLLLVLAGFLGASVQSASGRAVMASFPGSQRGLALGIRQTAIPISGFAASLALPPIVRVGGTGWGFAAMGIACVTAAAVGACLAVNALYARIFRAPLNSDSAVITGLILQITWQSWKTVRGGGQH